MKVEFVVQLPQLRHGEWASVRPQIVPVEEYLRLAGFDRLLFKWSFVFCSVGRVYAESNLIRCRVECH